MRAKITLGLALAALLVVPTAASAGIGWEIAAADQVSRVATHRAPRYDFAATCRSVARTKFTCEFSGMNNSASCFVSGRASVTKVNRYRYDARIQAWNKSCF